jgi:hypothetical protein
MRLENRAVYASDDQENIHSFVLDRVKPILSYGVQINQEF